MKSNQQHRNDAITAPLPQLQTLDGQTLELRPLSLGSINLLQRVGNALFTAEADTALSDDDLISAPLEVIYILGGPLDEVRRVCFGPRLDFDLAVQIFAESLDISTLAEIMDTIASQQAAADAAIVEPRPEGDDEQDADPNVCGQSGTQDS